MSRRALLVAGGLDQLAIFSPVLYVLGLGVLLPAADDLSGLGIGLGIGLALLGTLTCFLVLIWTATRHGSTAGLFVLGARFDPDQPVDWHDDALDWLGYYWVNVVLVPAVWLLDKIVPNRAGTQQRLGFQRDPRARGAGAGVARVVLGCLLVASPVLVVLALLG